jgi:hypothetical protein
LGWEKADPLRKKTAIPRHKRQRRKYFRIIGTPSWIPGSHGRKDATDPHFSRGRTEGIVFFPYFFHVFPYVPLVIWITE